MNGGLTLAASGFPFWGVDAGGYSGFADEETYLRWTEFAAFSPIMRFHGVTPREPWVYSRYAVSVYKFYAWLRENLLKYSVHTAEEAHKTGIPMMRPLPIVFPNDKEAVYWEDEYFYGSDLLVAPVHQEGEKRRIYFPSGRWINLLDFRKMVGGNRIFQVDVPIDKIPVYIREGACILSVMNGELQLGQSMTYEKKNTVLMSRALNETSGKRYADGKEIEYNILGKTGEDFFMLRHAFETEFIVLLGFDRKPESLELNGISLPEGASLNALNYGSGWYWREDTAVIVSVPKLEKTEIHVIHKEQ